MATNMFGDPIEEAVPKTNMFGDPILADAEAGAEAVGPGGTQYTPEQLREYGTISAPPPAGQRFLEDYARPTAQMVGAGGGAVLGGGITAPTGPGALAGAVAGGGLGFAIGDEVVDLIEDWMGYRDPKPLALELKESAEDVRTGLTYELAGHSLLPAAKSLKRPAAWVAGKFTKKGAEAVAGDIIAAMTDKGPLIAKNWEEAKALEAAMPGLKFDLGQLTGEPGIIKFAQAGAETSADIAARQAEGRVANTKAIQDFLEQSREAGAGTRDIKKPLAAQKALLEETEYDAEGGLRQITEGLQGDADPMGAGNIIRKELEAGERAARDTASEIFAEVPEQNLIADDLLDEIRKINKPSYGGEGPRKFPGVIKRNIKFLEDSTKVGGKAKAKAKAPRGITNDAYDIAQSGKYTSAQAQAKSDAFKSKAAKLTKEEKFEEAMVAASESQKWREVAESMEGAQQHKGRGLPKADDLIEPSMTLKDLQGFRSEVLEDLRTAKSKGLPASYRNRLKKALDAIDEKLTHGVEGGSAELKAAQKFFREEVIERYHKGATKGIMRGEESVQDAMVSGKFFKTGAKGQQAASEFLKALGDNKESIRAISNHIDDSLYNIRSDKTGELTQAALNRWLKNHRPALKEYGLENRYDSLVKARAALDEARVNSKAFDKSAASRVLNADVNEVVKKAFSGTGSKKEAAKELIGQVKGDRRASAGLQNAMIDEILTEVPLESPKKMRELLTSTKMAEQFRKYDAAIREIFKDAPEKIKAMHQVRRAVRTMEYKTGLPGGASEKPKAVLERLAGNYGHAKSTARSIAADMVNYLGKKIGMKDVNKYINRAILDPELATAFMHMAKGGKPEKVGIPFVNRLIATGLITVNKENE